MGRLLAGKNVRRYWLESKNIRAAEQSVLIDGDSFHHIFDVCRQEMGSRFEVLGDAARAHLVQVTSIEKKKAHAQILSSRDLPALKCPHLNLALAVSRYPVMDAVV